MSLNQSYISKACRICNLSWVFICFYWPLFTLLSQLFFCLQGNCRSPGAALNNRSRTPNRYCAYALNTLPYRSSITMPQELSTILLPGKIADFLATTDNDYVDYTSVNESTTLTDLVSTDNVKFTTFLPAMDEYFPAIPEADVKVFSHITRSFINPSLGIIGFVGNILGVGVLWRQARQQKLSIFWYLCALTIADIVFLALAVVDGIPRVVSAFDKELSKYLIAHFRTGLTFVDNTLLHTARFIVVLMSCDRLVTVVNPLHVTDSCFSKYPLRIVIGCLIFNVIIASPLVIFSTVITLEKDNITEYVFTFRNYDNFMAQWWIAEAVIHNFIPMFILIPVNIAIPLMFYRTTTRIRRRLNKEGSKQQGKVTATVLAITIMYTFLSIPLMVMKLFQYINPDFNMQGKYRLYFWFMADMSKCLAYINAATDFIVYFLVSNNYRVVFKSMYCGLCTKTRRNQLKYQTDISVVASKDSCWLILNSTVEPLCHLVGSASWIRLYLDYSTDCFIYRYPLSP